MTELTISLDTKSSRPLYEQIYAYIKEEIQAGGLPFKERLPSSRNLAKYLQEAGARWIWPMSSSSQKVILNQFHAGGIL